MIVRSFQAKYNRRFISFRQEQDFIQKDNLIDKLMKENQEFKKARDSADEVLNEIFNFIVFDEGIDGLKCIEFKRKPEAEKLSLILSQCKESKDLFIKVSQSLEKVKKKQARIDSQLSEITYSRSKNYSSDCNSSYDKSRQHPQYCSVFKSSGKKIFVGCCKIVVYL